MEVTGMMIYGNQIRKGDVIRIPSCTSHYRIIPVTK